MTQRHRHFGYALIRSTSHPSTRAAAKFRPEVATHIGISDQSARMSEIEKLQAQIHEGAEETKTYLASVGSL